MLEPTERAPIAKPPAGLVVYLNYDCGGDLRGAHYPLIPGSNICGFCQKQLYLEPNHPQAQQLAAIELIVDEYIIKELADQ